MAAADTATSDSIKRLGEAIRNLRDSNLDGLTGIESALRKEFSSQNKLLNHMSSWVEKTALSFQNVKNQKP